MLQFRKSLAILLLAMLGTPLCGWAEPVSIVAVGDLLLGGSATRSVERYGFDYPFRRTSHLTRTADIAMANLEAPLTDRGDKHPDKKYTFRVPAAAAVEIKRAGFDLVTLANNHIGDYGEQGVLDTIAALDEAGLGRAGAGRDLKEARAPHVVEIDGTTFAFLAYSNTFPKSFYAKKDQPGTAPGYFEYVAADIRKASKKYDVVVASFHWGGERLTEPKDYQVDLGRLAIDSGARAVIGHHPHVLQGAELYNGGVIYYSLGNFAFGSYSKNAVTAGMARIWFEGDKLTKAEILPLNVYNNEVHFQPRPLSNEPAAAFASDFNAYSEPFNTRLYKQPGLFWGLVAGRNTEAVVVATKAPSHEEEQKERSKQQ